MSRLEFRTELHGPRPRAAWVLALVASASLWITQQVSPWAVAIQVGVIAWSYRTRSEPRPLQRSALLLNLSMLSIASLSVAMALQGYPAVVALAHFAALAQALQLFDARPRKTEFLFVTLALFQVILATNLTDSIFFPPLLMAFLVSATWTFTLHTLRSEANEAQSPAEWQVLMAERPPGLLRMTAIASLASLLVALALFVTLPRFRASILQAGGGTQSAVSGFSDRMELGSFGRIRKDHSVVLRVETLEGRAPEPGAGYWRGMAFDAFDGRSWSVTPTSTAGQRRVVPGSPRFGLDIRPRLAPRDTLVQRIVREPVEAGVLFGVGLPHRIEGPFDRLEADANDGYSNPLQPNQRVRYTVWTDSRALDDATLRQDTAIPPLEHAPLFRSGVNRFLVLPEFDPEIAHLAGQIVADAVTDADRARAIERHLRQHGDYTDAPPPLGDDGVRSPVEDFLLGDLAGHCEYFASAMVVLARSAGLPSRIVNGFAGGRRNELGNFTELTSADAHAWVEIHYEDAGWVRYDPTPPDRRLRALEELSLLGRLAEIGSVVELWWFQRVVDFDTSDQVGALRAAWSGWRLFGDFGRDLLAGTRRPRSGFQLPELTAAPILPALLLALLYSLWRLQGRQGLRGPGGESLPRTYLRALRLLKRHGLVRTPTTTARDFSLQVREVAGPAAGNAFEHLTECYLAERFGALAPAGDAEALEALRTHLHEVRQQPPPARLPESAGRAIIERMRPHPNDRPASTCALLAVATLLLSTACAPAPAEPRAAYASASFAALPASTSESPRCPTGRRQLMWRARAGSAEAILFGSIHLGQPGFYPLPEPVEEAFAATDHLVVEFDLRSPSNQRVLGEGFGSASLSDGQTLEQTLAPDLYHQLQTELTRAGLAEHTMARLQPWAVAVALTTTRMMRLGFHPDYGVDVYFLSRAGERSIVELESPRSQLDLFESLDGPTFLTYTLLSLENFDRDAKRLVQTWSCGDEPALEALILDDFGAPDAGMDVLLEKIFYERNREMADAIEELLGASGRYFVVVGAGHLIGDQGIVSLLRERGLAVEPI